MKVVLYPADEGGCAFFRCIEPLRVSGVQGEVKMAVDMTGRGERRRRGTQILSEHIVERYPAPLDADVVVFQRPPHQDTIGFIEHFQREGIAVVIDVDDDLRAVDPRNAAAPLHMGLLRPDVHARFTARCCQLADLVTVSTPALAERYGAHGRVQILENCVPERILSYPRASDGRTLGWSGKVATHPGDLEATRGGVAEALSGDWRFHVVGDATDVQAKLQLPCEPTQTPWILDVDGYHRALGQLDVGIVPLADTAFNCAKSWLKGIEYAARGVPFVASPRAEYQRLGLGLLAKDRARNWRSAVRALTQDEGLREEVAEQGRETIRQNHLYETEGWRWAEAWGQAIANRAARVRVAA